MNLHMSEPQQTLFYIAENMKMEKSISEEGYKYFQMAINALSVIDTIKEEINTPNRGTSDYFIVDEIENIINQYEEGIKEK